jgi:hypothetical protein
MVRSSPFAVRGSRFAVHADVASTRSTVSALSTPSTDALTPVARTCLQPTREMKP